MHPKVFNALVTIRDVLANPLSSLTLASAQTWLAIQSAQHGYWFFSIPLVLGASVDLWRVYVTVREKVAYRLSVRSR